MGLFHVAGFAEIIVLDEKEPDVLPPLAARRSLGSWVFWARLLLGNWLNWRRKPDPG